MRNEISAASRLRGVMLGGTSALAMLAAIGSAVLTAPAHAQSAAGDAATIAELRRQLDEMRRRLEELESRVAPPAQTARRPAAAVVPAPSRRPPPAQAQAEAQ
ncbi:hypothetical protein GXW77_08125, partial [Roseomonas alkaliterrae]